MDYLEVCIDGPDQNASRFRIKCESTTLSTIGAVNVDHVKGNALIFA